MWHPVCDIYSPNAERKLEEMQINTLIKDAHENVVNKGFYDLVNSINRKMLTSDLFTSEEKQAITNAFISQKLMLIVGEASEAMEALRKNDRENFEEEIADIAIRVADFSGNYGIDLDTEIRKKMDKNKDRPYKHGKEF